VVTGTGGKVGNGSEEGDPPEADAGRPAAGQKRVFVSNASYPADLRSAGGGSDGLAAGDKLCNTAAQAATLGGTWKAWLSGTSLAGTTDAADRIAEAGPWYRLDGQKAFNNKANLMTAPLVPLNVDENRRQIILPAEVWTGTRVGGRASALDCNGWGGGAFNGNATTGSTDGVDQRWTDATLTRCAEKARLYCLEQ